MAVQVAQVAMDYPGLGDVRELSILEIQFYYAHLIPSLTKGA